MSAVWIVTVRGDDSSDYSVDSVHETKASADACALHFSGFSTRVEEWKVRREIEGSPETDECSISEEPEPTDCNACGKPGHDWDGLCKSCYDQRAKDWRTV